MKKNAILSIYSQNGNHAGWWDNYGNEVVCFPVLNCQTFLISPVNMKWSHMWGRGVRANAGECFEGPVPADAAQPGESALLTACVRARQMRTLTAFGSRPHLLWKWWRQSDFLFFLLLQMPPPFVLTYPSPAFFFLPSLLCFSMLSHVTFLQFLLILLRVAALWWYFGIFLSFNNKHSPQWSFFPLHSDTK